MRTTSWGLSVVRALALVATMTGCQAVSGARPAPATAAGQTASPNRLALSVHVRPVPGLNPGVEMSVVAEADLLPRRFLVQKQWAGTEDARGQISDVTYLCDGNVVHALQEDLGTHHGWSSPRSCHRAELRYVLRPPVGSFVGPAPTTHLAQRGSIAPATGSGENLGAGVRWGGEFNVVVTNALTSAIAETTLILPDCPDDTRTVIDVDFDLSKMPESTGVYSLGPGPRETTTRAARHAYFAMGKFIDFRHAAGPLHLEGRLAGLPRLRGSSAMRSDLSRLTDELGRVFRESHPETLRLLFVGMPPGGDPHGTSLTASAVVWLDADKPWTVDSARLTAHEMFHLYNGQIITRAGPDEQSYWFSEGFTEFYTDELLRRAGLYTPKEWFDAVRDRMRRYHRHPACEQPNARAEMGWGGSAMQLPYLRGAVVATAIDHEIRHRSKGARSLDDFMRGLVRRARAGASPLDSETMLSLLTEEVGAEAGGRIRQTIVDGKRLMLPEDAFGPCVAVVRAGRGQDVRVRPGVDLGACLAASR